MELAVCGDSSSDSGAVDVSALSDADLMERMAELGRQRSQVEGQLAEAAAEMHRRTGGRGAAAVMRERLKVSSRQATAEVELAVSLVSKFPTTLKALRAGEITPGHARVIARVAADPEHADEPALLEMARGYPVDMFARMTRHYISPGASAEQRKRQRENRWASLVQDPDGSWRLSAYFDRDTGKHVSVALNQMVRSYRNGERRSGRQVTSQQRRADALANLITDAGLHLRPKVTLLLIADYDTRRRRTQAPALRRWRAGSAGPDRQARGRGQDPARHLQRRGRPALAGAVPARRERRPADSAGRPRRRVRQLRRSRGGRRAPPHRVVQPGRTHRHRQPVPAVRTLPPPRPRRRMATR